MNKVVIANYSLLLFGVQNSARLAGEARQEKTSEPVVWVNQVKRLIAPVSRASAVITREVSTAHLTVAF